MSPVVPTFYSPLFVKQLQQLKVQNLVFILTFMYIEIYRQFKPKNRRYLGTFLRANT